MRDVFGPQVWMAAPVSAADIRAGAEWPPPRLRERAERADAQRRAARGDLSLLIEDATLRTVKVNRVGAFLDTVSALLIQPDTAENISDPQDRLNLLNVIDSASRDACTHGATLIGLIEGNLVWRSTFRSYPSAEVPGGWYFIEPMVSINSEDGKPDIVSVGAYNGESIVVEIRKWEHLSSGRGVIGQSVASEAPRPAQIVQVNKPPVDGLWGTSDVDDLAPIAAEINERMSGIDYVVSRNERPVFGVYGNTDDLPAIRSLLDVEGASPGEPLTAAELRDWAPSLREHDVAVFPDGIRQAGYITWDGDMSASFDLLGQLERDWSTVSGMAVTEPADSAEVASGVAIARRNFRLVAKTARLHEELHAALEALVGPFDWPYIGEALGDGSSDGGTETPPPAAPMMLVGGEL